MRAINSTDKSAIKSFILKPLGIILGLVYTPMLLGYLGQEKYGVWASILSIINWINYCDIGIGNGLRNVLTKKLTKKEYQEAQKAVSTAYMCLSVIAFVLLVAAVIVALITDWKVVFNTTYNARVPVLISFVFICINFVLTLCNVILYALQKAELVSLQTVCVQVINIVGLFIITKISSANVVLVAILFGSSSLIVHLTASIQIMKKREYLRPHPKYFRKRYLQSINNLGLKFFIAQIAALVMYSTGNILVANLFGAEQVTPYSIADRVFNTGYSIFAALTAPFWSKTTADIESGNFGNVKKNFRKLNILAIAFSLACICVVLIFKPIVRLWIGDDVFFSSELILVTGLYYAIYSFSCVSSPFINGMDGVNGVMFLGIFQGIVNIPLSILLAKNLGLGIIGIKTASLILVLFGGIFQFVYFWKLIRKKETNLGLR